MTTPSASTRSSPRAATWSTSSRPTSAWRPTCAARRMPAIIDAVKEGQPRAARRAMAVGAEVEIETLPGYLPARRRPKFDGLYEANAECPAGQRDRRVGRPRDRVQRHGRRRAASCRSSTLRVGGITAAGPLQDVRVVDKDLAYVAPAKIMAMTVIDLLWDGAAEGQGDHWWVQTALYQGIVPGDVGGLAGW